MGEVLYLWSDGSDTLRIVKTILFSILIHTGFVLLLSRKFHYSKGTVFVFWGFFSLMMFLGWYRLDVFLDGCHQLEKRMTTADTSKDEPYWQITGRIYAVKEKEKQVICYLDQLASGQRVMVSFERKQFSGHSLQLIPGNRISCECRFQPFYEKRNEGGFDERSYYYSFGIAGKFSVVRYTFQHHRSLYDDWMKSMFGLRKRWKKKILQLVFEPDQSGQRGIYEALLLGEQGDLLQETKKEFQIAGILHILSISGLHISLIGSVMFRLLRKRRGVLFSMFFSLTVIACYVTMAGNGYAARRAFLMFFINLLSLCVGRTCDLLSAGAMALLFLVLDCPYCICHTGVQMSFLAVAGIGLLYEEGVGKGISESRAVKSFFSCLCINAMVRPVVIQATHLVSRYGVLMNLLILPTAGMMTGLGFAGVLVGEISLRAGRCLFRMGCRILQGYEFLCHQCSRLPGAVLIVGELSVKTILLYYGGILFFCFLFRKSDLKEKYFRSGFLWVLFFSILFGAVTGKEQSGFTVKMLDVGQGDSIFLSCDGLTILTDAGSSSIRQVGENVILPFLKANGVRRLDYLVVTHSDADHISAVKGLLAEKVNGKYYVKNLILPAIGTTAQDEAYLGLVREADRRGIRVLYFSRGTCLSTRRLTLTCLWPTAGAVGEDVNRLSLVFRLQYQDFQMVFTGDLTQDGEEALLALETSGLQKTDVLKVAHHGSDYSTGEPFLTMLKPQISLISCGKNNRYGHPGQKTLRRLVENGSRIYVTAEVGQITIRHKKGKVIVETFQN